MQILERCFRVYVNSGDLGREIAFCERLQVTTCERRVLIAERGVTAAKVGSFLIVAGGHEALAPVRHVAGILYLRGLDAFADRLLEGGAEILHGPMEVTGGAT